MSSPADRPFRALPSHFDLRAILTRPRDENEAIIRSLCRTAYLGDHTALCRVLGRYKMYVDTQDIAISPHLMLEGYWETWVTEEICRRVRPGMVVADIGANLGYFSLLMADLVGAQGFVHSFEPNPAMARRLRNSLDVNGFGPRSAVHEVALAAIDGEPMVFIVPPNHPGGASLEPLSGEIPPHGSLVETRCLDSEEAWSAIELAKIDAEGAEELIWAGAQGLLSKSRLKTVILEFTPRCYPDPRAFLEKLAAPGFSLAYIDPYQGVMPIGAEALLARRESLSMLVLER